MEAPQQLSARSQGLDEHCFRFTCLILEKEQAAQIVQGHGDVDVITAEDFYANGERLSLNCL